MDNETIDWLILGIVIILLIVSAFTGFGPSKSYLNSQSNTGLYFACISFIIYGGSGVLRQRILFGAGIRLLTGISALLVSIVFLTMGLYGLYLIEFS